MGYKEKIAPAYTGYQELHVHTVGSFRDAANTVKDVFDAAEELGRNAVAITDHGNWTRLFDGFKERTKREKKILEKELTLLGVQENEQKAVLKSIGNFDSVRNPTVKMMPFVEKYESAFVNCAKKSIQFIPGVEMYESEEDKNNTSHYHIVFYAKDWIGAKALFKLCNLAQLNKRGDMPCCTMKTMAKLLGERSEGHGHVIATSACVGGRIPATLLEKHYIMDKQQKLLNNLKKITVISDTAIENAKASVLALKEKEDLARTELKTNKTLAKKDYAKAIQRAAAAVDKAATAYEKAKENSTKEEEKLCELEKRKAAYREAMENDRLSKLAAEKTDDIEQALNTAKSETINAVCVLAEMVKQNKPAEAIKAKIAELDLKAQSVPNGYEKAKELAVSYESIFGKGNFYIELQDHGILEELIIRNNLIRLARETGIPLTVANDVHYKNPQMKHKRDIIASLRFNSPIEEVAQRTGNDQLWFKPTKDMIELFKDVPEAIENTNRIAEQCNVFYEKKMHLPEYVDEKQGLSPSEHLKTVACNNVRNKYPEYDKWDNEKKKEFRKRLKYELDIIEKMGYSSYISIVEDFITDTKKKYTSESVGAGRGSGAGSLVNYLVGITDVDPLRYNLVFERFLNPERVSMPKIYWAFIVNCITHRCV